MELSFSLAASIVLPEPQTLHIEPHNLYNKNTHNNNNNTNTDKNNNMI